MFWTEELYEKAYNIVKDRKYPIIIPSYNRPQPIVLDKFFNDFTEEYNWPIYFIVRKSQEEEYRRNLTNKYVTIISYNDEEINDFGKVKNKCLEYANENGYKRIFSMDDDMFSLGFNTLVVTKNGSNVARKPKYDINSAKFFALWQLASEVCFDKYNSLIVFPSIRSSSWPYNNIDKEQSVRLICGKSPAHCLNVEEIMKRSYKYESDRAVGFSDLDFMINLYSNGDISCSLPWIYYEMPTDYMSVQNYEWFKSLDERLEKSTKVLFERHGEKTFIKEITKTLKNGEVRRTGVKLDNIKIRKEMGISKFKFNIYEDIKQKYGI